MNPSFHAIASRPLKDVFHGLDRCLAEGWRQLLWVCAGVLLGWWIYVPIHELLHAFACEMAGGEVYRLEIHPAYGGGFLANWFSFVTPGGDYAGRLADFDDHGSDWIYLITVFGPYVLSIFPGVWLLRWAASRGRSLSFGLTLPLALAPIIAITGDAYEIGALAVTQLPLWASPELSGMIRGDDLIRKLLHLVDVSASVRTWLGTLSGLVVGVIWGLVVYTLGALIARHLNQPAVAALGAEDGLS